MGSPAREGPALPMSEEQCVLALDFGTSSLKAGLIDLNGKLLWSGHSVFPQVPSYQNWTTKQWLSSMEKIFAQLRAFLQTPDQNSDQTSNPNPAFNQNANRRRNVPDALVISGNGPTLVTLGEHYRDQRQTSWPVLLWMTANDHALEGEKSWYLPKIHWQREHNLASFNQAKCFMPTAEYISWVLTGVESVISPNAQFSEYIWTEDSLRAYELSPALFPSFISPGQLIGNLDKIGASISGLPPGLPIIAGGSDFLMSLIGTGVLEDGLCCDRAGTSEGINYCSATPATSEELLVMPHFKPKYYNVAGILAGTGRMFEWFRSISHQQNISYIDMMKRIVAVTESQPLFFPSLHKGSRWEFSGGMLTGLQPDHDSAILGRAVVVAIGFSIKATLASLERAGYPVRVMRSCGGQAKNDLWCQMKADISSVSIEIPEIEDAELTGSAILGFVGLGCVSSVDEGARLLVRIKKRFDPEPENRYHSQYRAWMKSYEYMREAIDLLSKSEEA